jgi:hypothetical protein
MRTEDLARMLAANVEPIDPLRSLKRSLLGISVGLLAALGIMSYLLHLNPGLGMELSEAGFWIRELYCVGLGVLGVLVLGRLGSPGSPLGLLPMGIVALILAMWTLAVFTFLSAPASAREHLLLGGTFKVCPFLIALVATPLLFAMLWIAKGLAPTRLRRSGAAAGFVAGALGALVYSLHCPELAPPFIGTWYLLGILIPTLIGAVIGPQALRW